MSDLRPVDHDQRMRAAEARAAWELGDPSWAGRILGAYWNPVEDREALWREKGEFDTAEREASTR